MHARPQLTWSELEPSSLSVTTDYAVAVRLDLHAVVGNLRFPWTEQSFVPGQSSGLVGVTLPDEVLDHPEIVGFPIQVIGTLHTDYQSVAIPALHGTVQEVGDHRLFHRGVRQHSVPYVEAFFPPRDPARPREGAEADSLEDTGLIGGAR